MALDIVSPFTPKTPQQGPPETTAPADFVPFVALDNNVNSYDNNVQQSSTSNFSPEAQRFLEAIKSIPGIQDTFREAAKLQKAREAAGWNYNNPSVKGGVSYPPGTEYAGAQAGDQFLPIGGLPAAQARTQAAIQSNNNQATLPAQRQQQSDQPDNNLTQDQALIAQIKEHASAGQGFWPKALATLAALSGNFGPAMMLEEQKRKTQLAIDAAPLLVRANQYKNRGEYDKAISLLQEGMGTFGPRSPEIATHLTKEIENIDKKSQDWGSAETTYKSLVAQAKIIKQQTGQDPLFAPMLPVMQDIVSKKPIGGEKTFATLLDMVKNNQVQQSEGAIRVTNTASGITTTKPFENVMRAEDFTGIPGQQMSAHYGMSIPDMVNAGNGLPFTYKGEQQQPNPIIANAIKGHLAALQGPQAEREMAKLAPMSPGMNEQVQRIAAEQGMSAAEVRDRGSRADWSPEIRSGAYHAEIAKGTELATAGLEAQLNAPSIASNTNQIVVDKETGQLRPQISIREAGRHPDQYSVLDRTTQVPQAQALYAIRDRLGLVADLIHRLPSNQDTLDRMSYYVDRFTNDKLGLSASTTADAAIQHIVKNDIEAYFNKKGVSAERMADLTRGLTDRTATKESALATLQSLKAITESDRSRLMDQESKSNVPASSTQQTSQQYSPTRQAITAMESGGKGAATPPSYLGAVGEHQIMPATAAPYLVKLGYRPDQLAEKRVNDAVFNAIMDEIEPKYPGRPDLSMAEYHAGPKGVLPNGTVNPASKERDVGTHKGIYTTEYVRRGMEKLREQQASAPSQSIVARAKQALSPPTATSTPEQDAAYRAQQQGQMSLPPQQATEGTGSQPISAPVKKPGVISGTLR